MSQIVKYAETVTYKRELMAEEIAELERKAAKIFSYYGNLKEIIDACGKVSYYWNMKHGLKGNVQQMKMIASAYQHDLKYYEKMLNEWRWKAKRALATFKIEAHALNIAVNPESEYKKALEWDDQFLRQLAISDDRRRCYKEYIASHALKVEVLSVEKLEELYQDRLIRRAKKSSKKKS